MSTTSRKRRRQIDRRRQRRAIRSRNIRREMRRHPEGAKGYLSDMVRDVYVPAIKEWLPGAMQRHEDLMRVLHNRPAVTDGVAFTFSVDDLYQ